MKKIEIDNGSGFCFGVTTAIRKAEEELAKRAPLYCLGDIVHNGRECERLKQMGLITINHDEFKELHDVKVLLRVFFNTGYCFFYYARKLRSVFIIINALSVFKPKRESQSGNRRRIWNKNRISRFISYRVPFVISYKFIATAFKIFIDCRLQFF